MSSYKTQQLYLHSSHVQHQQRTSKNLQNRQNLAVSLAPRHTRPSHIYCSSLSNKKSNYPSFSTSSLSDITRYSLLSLARTFNPSYLHLKYNLFLRNIAISSSRKYLNAILTCFIASLCQARYITLLAYISLYASYFFIFACITR